MRALHVLVIVCLFNFIATAQKYGNEWITFSQKYFKFSVYKEGIYRIDSTTLSKYFDLNATNPKNIQVFIKGVEQLVYIKGESDNKINTGDFIEFYADGNTARVDSLLYTNINYQPNPYIPIFGDSLVAFITTNNSQSNKRYTLETDISINAYPAANYFYNEKVFTSALNYNAVNEYNSAVSDPLYTQAEGFGYPIFYETTTGLSSGMLNINFGALNPYSNPNLSAYISFNGSGYGGSKQLIDHRFSVYYSDQSSAQVLLKDTSFGGFLPIRQTYKINSQNIGNLTSITFTADPSLQYSVQGSTYRNFFILHYAKLVYPQTLNLGGSTFYKMQLDDEPNAAKSGFSFNNFNYGTSSNVEFFDLTNGKYIKTTINSTLVDVVVPNGGARKLCVMAGDSNVIKVKSMSPVNKTGYFTNYVLNSGAKPFVIIYGDALTSSATSYKNYRQSAAGGAYNVVFANVDALYEQFSYGVKYHPISIKHFVNYLYDNLFPKPEYVLLIGHGVNHVHANVTTLPWNLVPAIGIPSGDYLYTAGFNGNDDYSPVIPLGRVAALNNTEVENYTNSYES